MTTHYRFILTTGLVLTMAGFLFTGKVRADGKQLFIDNKCNKCHEGRGISLLPKTAVSGGDEEEDASATDASGKKIDPPKIEDMKTALLKEHGSLENAKKFVPLFLTKQTQNKEGRKHKKKFNGDPKDLQEITEWLLQ